MTTNGSVDQLMCNNGDDPFDHSVIAMDGQLVGGL